MPDLYTSMQGGGDLKCLDLDASFTGTAHFEGVSEEEEAEQTPAALILAAHDEDDEHDHEEPPAGLSFEIDGPEVSWSSTFPMAAVIVKGGANTHAYLYDPNRLSDSGLITPPNESGNPNDVSSIRFCWTGDAAEPDLVELCEAAAAATDAGEVVSTAGPMSIREGAVDTTTVPTDVDLTFDPMMDSVGFVAPFPVVAVVTAASDPVIEVLESPATSGSVPLSSNPGDGDVVLCGLAATTVVDDPTGDQSTDESAAADTTDVTSTDDTAAQVLQDPTTIPTGGGPSGRTALALFAFVVLALGGSTSLLVWSRSG
jgi:hypothetical protein